MKTFGGLIIAGVIVLTQTVQLWAQRGYNRLTPEERARYQTEWMKKELGLDSVKVKQVYAINLKYAQKMETTMRQDSTRRQHRGEFRAIRDEKDRELLNVLTKEQYQLYLQKRNEMRNYMQQQAPAPGPRRP
jgi:hypothetical protein